MLYRQKLGDGGVRMLELFSETFSNRLLPAWAVHPPLLHRRGIIFFNPKSLLSYLALL